MIENMNVAPAVPKPPFLLRAVRWLWRLAADRVYRNVMWLYLVRPKGAFQPFNDTLDNRYPGIFEFAQAELGAASAIRILSYGCSTGDEVFSLRRYFPRAMEWTLIAAILPCADVASNNRRMPTSHL
jgi:hypothetical protein